MKTSLLTVGRTRPPFADDVAALPQAALALPGRRAGRGPRRARPAARSSRTMPGWLRSMPPGEAWTRSIGAAGSRSGRLEARDVCLLLGGPAGIPSEALSAAHEVISLGPQTMAHQLARVIAARAALPRREDPRRRALSPLNVRSRRCPRRAPTRSSELRAALQRAAGSVRGEGGAGPEPSLERPPKPELGDYSIERRDAAAPAAGAEPARGRRADRRRAQRATWATASSGSRWRGRASSTSSSPMSGTRRRSSSCRGGRRLRRKPDAEIRRAGPGRVRLRQPDRPADRGRRPPRGLRRRAGAAPRLRRPRRRARVLRQRRRAARSHASAQSIRPARDERADPPEDGYEGDYVAELAAQLGADGADPADLDDVARRGVELMLERSAPRFTATASTSTPGSRSARCTRATQRRSQRRDRLREERATPTSARARCGCARPSSATTRTACWCGSTASRPTSPPTSPTTRTSCERGYERLIDVLGADHHGYVARDEGRDRGARRRPGAARGR